eukprot:scaffold7378_cov198-Pinguiococcus_pyrenoidosus.AAC.1
MRKRTDRALSLARLLWWWWAAASASARFEPSRDSLRDAVDAWTADSAAAEARYGHISAWNTSGVRDLSGLF